MRTLYIKSAGVLLTLTALAKLAAAVSGPHIIGQHDPILGLQYRYEFWVIGLLELSIAFFCLFLRPCRLQYGLLAWLTGCFAVYRIGFWSIGMHFCPCLGNFSDAIHLSKETANAITLGILVYLLVGSFVGLIVPWVRESSK